MQEERRIDLDLVLTKQQQLKLREIRKIAKWLRRIDNLSRNLDDYETYKRKCHIRNMTNRPENELIDEKAKLQRKILMIGKYLEVIDFSINRINKLNY